MAQLERLKKQLEITDNDADMLLEDLLDSSKYAILARRYPFTSAPTDDIGAPILENRYLDLQVRIAVYLYNKMGAEGQISHSENGISRVYDSSDIPESLLGQVTSFVGSPLRISPEGSV